LHALYLTNGIIQYDTIHDKHLKTERQAVTFMQHISQMRNVNVANGIRETAVEVQLC